MTWLTVRYVLSSAWRYWRLLSSSLKAAWAFWATLRIADQYDPTEPFVMHLQHWRDHHTGRLLDRERNGVEEQLQPPCRVRVGIANDRQRTALALVENVGFEQLEILFALPGAVGVLGAPDLDELFQKWLFRRGGGWSDFRRIGHLCSFRLRNPPDVPGFW